MTVDNLLPHWPDESVLRENWVSLTKGEEMLPDILLEQLVSWGYVRRKLVSGPGDMAMRGDILDIHAPGYSLPLRLEFFGDILEEIRLFDPASQRSKQDLLEAVLLPVSPGVTTDGYADQAKGVWKRLRTTGEISLAEEQELRERLDRNDGFVWPGLFYTDPVGLEAYLPGDAAFLLSSGGVLRGRLEDQDQAWRDYIAEEGRTKGVKWPQRFFCRSHEGAREAWRDKPQLVFEELTIGREKNGLDLLEVPYSDFMDVFWQPEASRRPWSALMNGLKDWNSSGYQTILSFRSERSRKKFLTLAAQENLPISLEFSPTRRGLFALISPLRKGMELEWSQTRVLGEEVLQPQPARVHSGRDKAFKGLERYEDLSEGDLLVHRDYGLAQFGGLHHMNVGDATNDYLLLFFSGEDKLYLPVDRLNLVQRFKGPEGSKSPSLDKLGGTRWGKPRPKYARQSRRLLTSLLKCMHFVELPRDSIMGRWTICILNSRQRSGLRRHRIRTRPSMMFSVIWKKLNLWIGWCAVMWDLARLKSPCVQLSALHWRDCRPRFCVRQLFWPNNIIRHLPSVWKDFLCESVCLVGLFLQNDRRRFLRLLHGVRSTFLLELIEFCPKMWNCQILACLSWTKSSGSALNIRKN